MNSAAVASSTAASSTEDGLGTSRVSSKGIEMLGNPDNQLEKAGREARASTYDSSIFTAWEDEFHLLTAAKNLYRETDYSAEGVRVYPLRPPRLDNVWGPVFRGILRSLPGNSSLRHETPVGSRKRPKNASYLSF
jgi:hypothetical protein